MTPLRTRLGMATLLNLTEMRLHLRDENLRKNTKARLKRHFGERIPVPTLAATEQNTPGAGTGK